VRSARLLGAQVFAAHRRVARQEHYCLIILATDGSGRWLVYGLNYILNSLSLVSLLPI